jgi:hypothetical protein
MELTRPVVSLRVVVAPCDVPRLGGRVTMSAQGMVGRVVAAIAGTAA